MRKASFIPVILCLFLLGVSAVFATACDDDCFHRYGIGTYDGCIKHYDCRIACSNNSWDVLIAKAKAWRADCSNIDCSYYGPEASELCPLAIQDCINGYNTELERDAAARQNAIDEYTDKKSSCTTLQGQPTQPPPIPCSSSTPCTTWGTCMNGIQNCIAGCIGVQACPTTVLKKNGESCANNAECSSGSCCNGVCTDTSSDSSNCGACGSVCTSGQTCTQGVCACQNGQPACGATCCPAKQICSNDTCIPLQLVNSLCLVNGKHIGIDQANGNPYVDYTDVNGAEQIFEVSGEASSLTAQGYTQIGSDTFVTIGGRSINLSDVRSGAACGGGAGTPSITCKRDGEACASGGECCSGYCKAGTCGNTITVNCTITQNCTVEPPPFRPILTTVTPRNSTLISLLGWSKWKSAKTSSCIRGASCNASSECCNAECVGGYCLCGMSACSASGECCTGYCEDGQCKIAPTMSSFLFSKPLQGCAGLVEECLPDETSCVFICDGLMILLLISAIGAGFVAWKKFDHPAAGIVAAVIPILFGILFYVFVGIISAIAEIAILSYLGEKAKEVQAGVESDTGRGEQTGQ